MKIVHVCLSGMYTIGWSYQENLLTKYHHSLGYEVTMITSKWVYGENSKIKKTNKMMEDDGGVKVVRLNIKNDKNINSKFKRYENLYKTLEFENPDILFIHGCQFLDIKIICQYLKKHNVTVYVDNHADFSNSATNFVSRYFLHRIVWKYCAQLINPYVTKFYGVLPSRVDFLISEYKLPKEKVELLVMGLDDRLADEIKEKLNFSIEREKIGVKNDEFVIVTGGKIDLSKQQTLSLMKYVNESNMNIKLLIFGSVVDELVEKFNSLLSEKITYLGWLNQSETIKYCLLSDLAVFPGRHSVIWEQVCGLGIPMVVKDWSGTHHIDMQGNVIFLKKDSDLESTLSKLLNDSEKIKEMKKIANENKQNFYYSSIAMKSINKEKKR